MPTIDSDAHVLECEKTFDYMDPQYRKYRPWVSLQKSNEVSIRSNDGGEQKEFWVIDGRLQPKEGNVGYNTTQESREMANIDSRLDHMDELSIDVPLQDTRHRLTETACQIVRLIESSAETPPRVQRHGHHGVCLAENLEPGLAHHPAQSPRERAASLVFQRVDDGPQ